jgi:hypothetical protein
MRIRNLTMALLITFVLGAGVGLHRYENVRNAAVVRQLSDELEQTKSELVDATVRLSEANKKLGFLESSKARVQVTAYALTDDFGPDPVFSNNAPSRSAFAVPKHTLPAGEVLNVALSPIAERMLHANLNDTIVLMSGNRVRKHLARFVDRTAQTETRSVVDILFADAHAPASGGGAHSMRSTFPSPTPHFSSDDPYGSRHEGACRSIIDGEPSRPRR